MLEREEKNEDSYLFPSPFKSSLQIKLFSHISFTKLYHTS